MQSEIPEDVMKAAREAAAEAYPDARHSILAAMVDGLYMVPIIARAILAERARAALSAAEPQPAPSVAVKVEQTKCKNCGGNLNSWFTSNRVNSVAVDGRLKSSEISCDFVLGCDECSETLRVVRADEVASQMNAALSAQVQDVVGHEPFGAPGPDAMRVIDPDQWEPCSPDYLKRGGCCATAPRVWNAERLNHYHPKLPAAPAKQEG